MALLITYVLIALVFSFFCSIAEAVLLSVTPAYIAILEKEKKPAGAVLKVLKANINKPLSAILTLNTIAHTIGAAGAGAQAAAVFGSAYVGIISAILTFLILIFSEIIPKTIGAAHWRSLAPATAFGVKLLTWLLYPFVWLSQTITLGLVHNNAQVGFSRDEFTVMAELSEKEGQLKEEESRILKNLLLLRNTSVRKVMTPSTVLFTLSNDLSVEAFFHKYDHVPFSRIPTYSDDKDNITGFVIRKDVLLAQARGNTKMVLETYRRDIGALLETVTLLHAFNEFLRQKAQIMLVVNEYGTVRGIVTMEDLFETLLGVEIVDESDKIKNMQQLAKKNWRKKARTSGVELDDEDK
jgi:CBS domain containing-hemolysin-like protein